MADADDSDTTTAVTDEVCEKEVSPEFEVRTIETAYTTAFP